MQNNIQFEGIMDWTDIKSIDLYEGYANILEDSYFDWIEPTRFEPYIEMPIDYTSNLLSQEEILSITAETILPDDLMHQSVIDAGRFFEIPDPSIIAPTWAIPALQNSGTCMLSLVKDSFFDDIVAFDKEQLLSMGITTQQGVDLVMTHEIAHRLFQNSTFSGVLSGAWEEELACDYMAGVRAGFEDIDITEFSNAMSGSGSPSHPSGNLRADFVQEGKDFVLDYQQQHNGDNPSYQQTVDHLKEHLSKREMDVIASRVTLDTLGVEGMYGDSFFDNIMNRMKEKWQMVS